MHRNSAAVGQNVVRVAGAVAMAAAFVLIRALAAVAASAKAADTPYTWRNVEIVGGGFVDGFVFHPTAKGLCYARTDVGGAYRWDATRSRWIPLTDAFGREDWNLTGIESIAIDPTDADRVYAAAGTYTNDWAGNGAILRSSDRGRTWARTNMPFKFGGNEDGRFAGERLAVDPHAPNVLLLGTRHSGLWRSADRGATWARVTGFLATGDSGGVGIVFVDFDPVKPNRLWIGVSDKSVGLYRSDDGGATFVSVPGQPSGLLVNHGVLSHDGQTMYLSYGDQPGPNGMTNGAVWRFDIDAGLWTSITPETPGAAGAPRFGYAGLSVDAQDSRVAMVATMDHWAGGDTIFRTTDAGAHWTDIKPKSVRDWSRSPYLNWGRPTADLGHWIGALAIDPTDSDHALYGTGATIWMTHDAASADRDRPTHWEVGAEGLEELVVTGLVSPPAGAPLLSTVLDLGGFRHESLTESPRAGFFQPSAGSNTGLDYAGLNPDIVARIYGGNAPKGAYSTDNGRTWTPFPGAPPGPGGGTIAVSADGSAMIWSREHSQPYASKDRGATWAACAGLTAAVPTVAADRADPARFYAFDRTTGTICASVDDGANFGRTAIQPPARDAALYAAPDHVGDLYLTADGLRHSTDGGATWVKLDSVTAAYRLGFGKPAPGIASSALYLAGRVGGIDGIFRSTDTGVTWTRIDDDHHRFATINAITGDPRVFGRVYIATGGRGILYGEP